MEDPLDLLESALFPTYVRINVNAYCDAHCCHCHIWRSNRTHEMSAENWLPTLRSISRWLGPVDIQIAGGEPLLSPSLPFLLAKGAELHLPMGLATNGLHLDDEWARRLTMWRIRTVNFALDGFQELHDRIRGVPDAFRKVLEAAGRLGGLGVVKPRVTCVIMRDNLDQLVEFAEFVCSGRFDGIFFQALTWPFGSPYASEWWKTNPHWPDNLDHVGSVLGRLLEMKMKGMRILNCDEQFEAMRAYFRNPEKFTLQSCAVADNNITIEPDGAVRLCPMEDAIGRTPDQDLEDIWRSEAAAACRKKMAACRTNCHLLINCAFDAGMLIADDARR